MTGGRDRTGTLSSDELCCPESIRRVDLVYHQAGEG